MLEFDSLTVTINIKNTMMKKKKTKELTVGIICTTSATVSATFPKSDADKKSVAKVCAGEKMRKRCKSGGLKHDDLKRIYKNVTISKDCICKDDAAYNDVNNSFAFVLNKAKANMTEYELLIMRTRAVRVPERKSVQLKSVKRGDAFRFTADGKLYVRKDYSRKHEMFRYSEVGKEDICRYANGELIVIIN